MSLRPFLRRFQEATGASPGDWLISERVEAAKSLLSSDDLYLFNEGTHFHLYDIVTGNLTDVPAEQMRVVGLPELPPGTRLEQIDVIVRISPQT